MTHMLTEMAVAIVASVLITIMVAGAGAAVAPIDDDAPSLHGPKNFAPDRFLPNALT